MPLRPTKLIFTPDRVRPRNKRDIYEDGPVTQDGSYLWLRNEIEQKLGYPKHVFEFDDNAKTIKCRAPLQYFKENYGLIRKIGLIFGYPFSRPDRLAEDNVLGFFSDESEESSATTPDNLAELANRFFESLTLKSKPSDVTDFASLLNHSFCVGESHSSAAPKRFLIENMETLKNQGYSTLFLEHLFYDSVMQDSLDEYCNPPKDKPMPKDLERYLTDLGKGYCPFGGYDEQFNFCTLVEAAKKHGIRIVGIDTEKSYQMGVTMFGAGGAERMKGMNFAAQEIIRKEARTGKWMALMGNAHIGTMYGVPGVSEIMGVPSIDISDHTAEQTEVSFGTSSRQVESQTLTSDVRISYTKGDSMTIGVLAGKIKGTTAVAEAKVPPTPEQSALVDAVIAKLISFEEIMILGHRFSSKEDSEETKAFAAWYREHKISASHDSTGLMTVVTKEIFASLNTAATAGKKIFGSALDALYYDKDKTLMRELLLRESRLTGYLNTNLDKLSKVQKDWDTHKSELKKAELAPTIKSLIDLKPLITAAQASRDPSNKFFSWYEGWKDKARVPKAAPGALTVFTRNLSDFFTHNKEERNAFQIALGQAFENKTADLEKILSEKDLLLHFLTKELPKLQKLQEEWQASLKITPSATRAATIHAKPLPQAPAPPAKPPVMPPPPIVTQPPAPKPTPPKTSTSAIWGKSIEDIKALTPPAKLHESDTIPNSSVQAIKYRILVDDRDINIGTGASIKNIRSQSEEGKKRGDDFRVVDGVYPAAAITDAAANEVRAQQEMRDAMINALVVAAAKAGFKNADGTINSDKLLEAIKTAKEKGTLNGTEFKKLSGTYQTAAADCGFYSGREKGKEVGQRLTFLPSDVIEKIREAGFVWPKIDVAQSKIEEIKARVENKINEQEGSKRITKIRGGRS